MPIYYNFPKILSNLKIHHVTGAWLGAFTQFIKMVLDLGTVISVKDGVVRASGLQKVASGETVKIGNIYGMALNLEANIVSIVIFGNDSTVREGDSVERTKSLMSVPVGDAVLGRVVNALGEPIDGKGPINTTETLRVERKCSRITIA